MIKITRTKRIQDGVVRLEFVAGPAAQEYLNNMKLTWKNKSAEQAAKEERDKLRDQRKARS